MTVTKGQPHIVKWAAGNLLFLRDNRNRSLMFCVERQH
jgi:hypothetical protein